MTDETRYVCLAACGWSGPIPRGWDHVCPTCYARVTEGAPPQTEAEQIEELAVMAWQLGYEATVDQYRQETRHA